MQFFKDQFNYLFNSTKGLILVAIAMIAMTTALFGTLSGPLAELGISDHIVRIFRMDLVQAEWEGRIIILYHSIAMGVVAIETYMVTGLLEIKEFYKVTSRVLITIGYLLAMIFGLGFAYWGHNWAFHGIYIAGLTLVFFAGVFLAIGLWPWNKEVYQPDKTYARFEKWR